MEGFQNTDTQVDLNYGVYQPEVRRAIKGESFEKLALSKLPIGVAYANIDEVSNDEYVMIRRNGLGASESSILLGVNPYKTVAQLVQEKARPFISEEERAVGEETAVRKGKDLEPLIIQKFQKYFDQHTFKPADMYRFKEFPYLTVNFDGVIGDAKQYLPAEIKVVTSKGERHYNPIKAFFNEYTGFEKVPENISLRNWSIQVKAGAYGIPPYYYTQLQQQMFALNAPFGYLSVLFERDWRFYSFFIWRDEAIFNDLVIQGYKTWEKIIEARRTSGWDKAGLDSTLTVQQQSMTSGEDPNTSETQSQKPSSESNDY